MLKIDNHLTKNAIRHVAIGRKNYLFAGPQDSTWKSTVIYTFLPIFRHIVSPRNIIKYFHS
ncbi:ISSfl4 ORF3 [Microscilla marina ATCC 23134]|uniref:ISSfl4 ORF3 n=2 Tax=Microscilla marina TaxID=1027 RepID=A1ZI89_MICM2|nr:ISSfl4 ORF3 [Microscilla marina ATCC 23134]